MNLLRSLAWRADVAAWTIHGLRPRAPQESGVVSMAPVAGTRVLLIPRPALGNLILFTPVIRCLAAAVGTEHVDLVLPPGPLADLFDGDATVNAVHRLSLIGASPSDIRGWIGRTDLPPYDVAISAVNPQGAFLADQLGVPTRVGFPSKCGWLAEGPRFLTRPVDSGRGHEVEQYLELTRALGLTVDRAATYVPIRDTDRDRVRALTGGEGRGRGAVVAVHAGSGPGLDEKRWPAQRFGAVMARMAAVRESTFLILGGREERALAQDVQVASGGLGTVVAGDLSIAETAALLEVCDVLVSNDSGPMHLAAAVGTKVAAVFGPTDPGKNRPWMDPDRFCVIRSGLECSPCYQAYSSKITCTNPHRMACLGKLPVEAVVGAVTELLDGG